MKARIGLPSPMGVNPGQQPTPIGMWRCSGGLPSLDLTQRLSVGMGCCGSDPIQILILIVLFHALLEKNHDSNEE